MTKSKGGMLLIILLLIGLSGWGVSKLTGSSASTRPDDNKECILGMPVGSETTLNDVANLGKCIALGTVWVVVDGKEVQFEGRTLRIDSLRYKFVAGKFSEINFVVSCPLDLKRSSSMTISKVPNQNKAEDIEALYYYLKKKGKVIQIRRDPDHSDEVKLQIPDIKNTVMIDYNYFSKPNYIKPNYINTPIMLPSSIELIYPARQFSLPDSYIIKTE